MYSLISILFSFYSCLFFFILHAHLKNYIYSFPIDAVLSMSVNIEKSRLPIENLLAKFHKKNTKDDENEAHALFFSSCTHSLLG